MASRPAVLRRHVLMSLARHPARYTVRGILTLARDHLRPSTPADRIRQVAVQLHNLGLLDRFTSNTATGVPFQYAIKPHLRAVLLFLDRHPDVWHTTLGVQEHLRTQIPDFTGGLPELLSCLTDLHVIECHFGGQYRMLSTATERLLRWIESLPTGEWFTSQDAARAMQPADPCNKHITTHLYDLHQQGTLEREKVSTSPYHYRYRLSVKEPHDPDR